MSEQLQTRTEHSRSLEDAERFKALEVLKELGFLIPLTDVDSYHGRLAYEGNTEWDVDPVFKNGSNDSGNSNINTRPTLYTSSAETADDFAQARGTQIINAKERAYYREIAEAYTDEQKQAWAERMTAEKQAWWNDLTPEHRTYYPNGPTIYNAEDFSSGSEARYLRDNVSDEDRAAFWRVQSDGMMKQVHEIVSTDSDATVINYAFDVNKLEDSAKKRFQEALKALLLNISEGTPLDFEGRHSFQAIMNVTQNHAGDWFSVKDVKDIAVKSGVDEDTVEKFFAATNSRKLAAYRPTYLVQAMLSRVEDVIIRQTETGEGEQIDIPISLEYIEKWLREAHIVGVKQVVDSRTVMKEITSVSLFDLMKVITKERDESDRTDIQRKMGAIAGDLETRMSDVYPLMRVLEDAHAKPQKLVDAAREVPDFQQIFDMDAGNWEGFTLAEHTETVLRNFEENYADQVPVSMLAPMRLAILAHDLGKPIAAQNGERNNQYVYNAKYAADFYDALGLDKKTKDLLLAVIGKGAQLMFDIDIRKKGMPAEAQMNEFTTAILEDFYDSKNVTDEQKQGFIEMCRMLQICDGGAYTTMAVTRSRKGPGRYRNAPSFQSSFAEPVGLGKRDIKVKE